ncbi:hypothetical protein QR680_017405 [Steinernema hermaphroditum]|uniref:Uncharacterized protein n=1 Tax=Steinernema hermaphroditum TaxID=289476 RepID=A0AA39HF06_9BILA|nr:hypothetical protein QR680_017405 [Steinernema hermaphroditum]
MAASTYLGVVKSGGGTTSTYLAAGAAGTGKATLSNSGTSAYYTPTNTGGYTSTTTPPSPAKASSHPKGKIGELEDRMARLEAEVKELRCSLEESVVKNKKLETTIRSAFADTLRELGCPESKEKEKQKEPSAPSGNSTMTAVDQLPLTAPSVESNVDYFATPTERKMGTSTHLPAPTTPCSGAGTTSAYLSAPGAHSGSGTNSAYFGVGAMPQPKPARNNNSMYMAPSSSGPTNGNSLYLGPK